MPLRLQQEKLPRAADIVIIFYQVVMVVTIVFHFSAVPKPIHFLIYHIVIITFLLLLPYTNDTALWKWLKNWNPILIIPINFNELHYLIHNVNPIDWDNALIQVDLKMYGIHPTLWMESWAFPLLTEYLQVIYSMFYFLPIVLAIILYRKKEHEKFDYFVYVMVYGYYACYIGYFIVPAIGPRFTLDHLQQGPVTGIWITDILRETLNYLENIQRDAFPSGHTELTLLTMIYAWKYSKKYFWILSIVGTSQIFSTVYLRYHYVIDVIAGVFLALLIMVTAKSLYDAIKKMGMNPKENTV